MSDYKRWIYILHDVSQYELLKDGELFYDELNNILYLRVMNGSDIIITDKRIYDHIVDYNNPHNITKEDLGLSKIPNLPLTSLEDFNNHLNDINPHGITKEQVGLDKVENYSFATNQDITNKAEDKYLSPYHAKSIVNNLIADKLEGDKVVFSVTTNTDNYLVSIRLRGSVFWVNGNNQIIIKGNYEYRIEAPGYYPKTGMIAILKNTDLHVDLTPLRSISLNIQRLDGALDFAMVLTREDRLYTWGSDIYGGLIQSNNVENKSIRHVFSHTDVYTVVYDDGTLFHWGRPENYNFLNNIPTDKQYKSFVMNQYACALIDENNKVKCYGDNRFTNSTPTTNMKSLQANENMFVGISENNQLVGWGIDANGMLNDIPLGAYKYVALSDTDALAIRDSNTIKQWGSKGLIKQADLPMDNVHMISISGDSIAYLSPDGELGLGGTIKGLVPNDAYRKTYTNIKLLSKNSLILITSDGGIDVFPRSTSVLYTSKPNQEIF